jgi:heterodisulfide reductase subunit B
MSERSFWKEMQINDMLVIDTIRKYGRDTIYFKDKDSKFIWNNYMHANQLGVIKPDELVGKSDYDFFPKEFADKANRYMANETPYAGEAQVVHYLEMLRDTVGFDAVKEKVVNALTGKKIAAYYGCLLLRPSSVMQMDDAENPTIMEDLIAALGATPVVYAKRNECCGGYIAMESPELAKKNSNEVVENAKAAGAEMIITACPLCRYNLMKNGADIPVVYFTELLAEALGVKEATNA